MWQCAPRNVFLAARAEEYIRQRREVVCSRHAACLPARVGSSRRVRQVSPFRTLHSHFVRVYPSGRVLPVR
jgi:hypothetical protein